MLHSVEQGLDFFCSICNGFVTDTAKHCSQCNKCILEFDHHCFWLNNCIGSKNYRTFCALIGVLEINTALIIIFESVYLSEAYSASIPIKIFSIVDIVICGCIEIGNGYLILFHIWLRFNHLTTYQYILSKRAKTNSKICQSPPSESQKTYGNILTTECHSNFRRGTSLRREGEDEHLKFLKDLSDYNNTPRSLTGKI